MVLVGRETGAGEERREREERREKRDGRREERREKNITTVGGEAVFY